MPSPLRVSLASLAVLLAAGVPRIGQALEAPRKIVDYDIKVSLEPGSKMVDGSETLRWTNPSDQSVSELKFHLYWNGFRNNRSTFYKESGGKLRDTVADPEKAWGWIDVTSMKWDGAELKGGFRFESPDDGNPDDRTVLSVALPRAVAAGETIALQIAWKAKVPLVFARAGYIRDFYMFGQWFPKIGVLEPAGRRRRATAGWNCHQYHAFSEFYADWGDYRVEITLPEKYVVVSAGTLQSQTRSGGKKTLTYAQDSIHDFAWAADPRFVVKTDSFDPARELPESEVERMAKVLGRTPSELRAGFRPVALTFAMQPDHAKEWTRYRDAQKWGFVWAGLHAFPYPYSTLTIVDTPEDGDGASGMEYQTLYTGDMRKGATRWPFNRVLLPEIVVAHEFAHSYWYGLLASNEFEEPWMDEGISSFAETEIVSTRFGDGVGLPFGVGFSGQDYMRLMAMTPEVDAIRQLAWKFSAGSSWGRNSYYRPSAAIQQLRRLLGEERFWRTFRAYCERWRYDHPTSDDFLEPMIAASPDPARTADYVQKTWYGTGYVDFQIRSASSERDQSLRGYDEAGRAVEKDKKKTDLPYKTVVVVGREGDISMPVTVRMTFADGRVVDRTWDGVARWIRYRVTYGSALAKVQVDPEEKVYVDRNPWNNAKHLRAWKGPSAAAKVRTYSFHLVEIVLSSLWAFV